MPGLVEARVNLGTLLLSQQKVIPAIVEYDAAAALGGENPAIRTYLGSAPQQAGVMNKPSSDIMRLRDQNLTSWEHL
jgi:hypothetical protein